MTDDEDDCPGKGRPPRSTQFPPGTSGNIKGRPKGKKKSLQLPYQAVLGRLVTLRENGVARKVSAETAFLRQTTAKGLSGDPALARTVQRALEKRPTGGSTLPPVQMTFDIYAVPGEISKPLRYLHAAQLHDAYRETGRMVLEPWLVEAALARLDRELTLEEQEAVYSATRKPHIVNWPAWWTAGLDRSPE